MTTGWNNQQATDKVIRTLKGGSSGRVAVFLIAAGFLALGIYTGNLWLSVPFGIATAFAAWAVVSAGRNDLAAGRMERRDLGCRYGTIKGSPLFAMAVRRLKMCPIRSRHHSE